jgi:DNA primase
MLVKPRLLLDAKQVKEQADIVAIAGRYTRLRRRGKQHVGLCPLHSERHPSFYVHPGKQAFYCFGCQRGGDVFGLVMLAEGVGFTTALEIVAGVASESEGRVATTATQGPKRVRAGEGASPHAAQRHAYIARITPEPKARPAAELSPLAVDCAAERHLETGR